MKIGLLSDAHGNAEAFTLAVSLLKKEGAEAFFFLGDAVGYLPGGAVVEALITDCMPAQKGNHEDLMLTGARPDREEIYRHGETLSTLGPLAAFVAAWPEERRVEMDGTSLLMVHGSPGAPLHAYVYPDSDLTPFETAAADAVFMANTHRPFIRRQAGKLFVNVGSCGLPRDTGGLGSACIYDSARDHAEILRFDIRNATREALARCGPVHPSVKALIERRGSRQPFGRFVDG